MSPSIVIRAAEPGDAVQLFEWRNDPHVRQMSANQAEISFQEHSSWLASVLHNKNRLLLIGELPGGQKIGVVRFDLDFEKMESAISVIIDPAMQGKKQASPFLRAAIEYLVQMFREKINSMVLIAQIRHENAPSLACFSRVGFVFRREDDNFKYFTFVIPFPLIQQSTAE